MEFSLSSCAEKIQLPTCTKSFPECTHGWQTPRRRYKNETNSINTSRKNIIPFAAQI
jgi:hypothetical protein